MTTKQLEILMEVADRGTINQAARYLFMTPQAVSASIVSLENELGFQIMVRSYSGINLTSEGERILREGRRMLEYYNSWRKFGDRSEKSRISITIATSALMNEVTAKAVATVLEINPTINITLLKTSRYLMDDLPNSILELGIDVGVCSVSNVSVEDEVSAILQRAGYRTERLFLDEYMVYTNCELNNLVELECFEREDLSKYTMVNFFERKRTFMYPDLFKYMNQSHNLVFSDGQSVLRFMLYAKGVCAVYPIRQMSRLYEMQNLSDKKIAGFPVRDFPMPMINLLYFRADYNTSPPHYDFVNLLRNSIFDWIE